MRNKNKKEIIETTGFALNVIRKTWPVTADLVGRHGGYMCLLEMNLQLSSVNKIRRVRSLKQRKYAEFCHEKAFRLLRHPEHTMSLQSRVPHKNQWGGAIGGYGYIWSFSGLTEALDSILMIGVALYMRDIEWENAGEMIQRAYPGVDSDFLKSFKDMSETGFEYGHFL
jgi:hypothetical protein